MTDQEMRIAIAEACGITAYDDRPDYGFTTANGVACLVPSYLTDLNADHAMELWLARNRPELENEYDRNLARETHGLNAMTVAGQPGFYVTLLRRAPARSRAMAFLRTVGKLKD